MKPYSTWPALAAEQISPFYKASIHPSDALRRLAPPSLRSMDGVIKARRQYADEYIERKALAESLHESHQRRQAPDETLKAIKQVANGAVMIIAGQQPGLMGGPLYTVYKAIQARRLAERISNEHGIDCVPAFWNASEDHDFDEIATAYWLSAERRLESYEWQYNPHGRPLYGIPAADFPMDAFIEAFKLTTHDSEFRSDLIETLQGIHAQAESYPDLFDQLLWRVVDRGLIVIRPDDAFMREGAARLIRREIEEPSEAARLVAQAGGELKAAGLAEPLHKREERASFFWIKEGQRLAVTITESGFETEDGRKASREEALNALRDDPATFSPSAILRPLIQDALLPTLASVLGPGEMGYHFLLDGIYKRHEVPRPAAVPRSGLTVLESRDLRGIEKLGLQPEDLELDTSALLKRMVSDKDGAPAHDALNRELAGWFDALKAKAKQTDPTIIKPLEKTLARIEKDLADSEHLLVRRLAAKESEARERIEALKTALRPTGQAQERALSFLSYYAKYGPDFIEQIRELFERIDDGAHVYAAME